ncbi:MAG: inositol monophosphatase [Lentisphaeria bacterium]|nr:inositol monophosphatase [Lentisphaeria bacterium]NQZ67978.1 inositol monophosphatase [Lentisphaeria bacterium]
MNKDLINDVKSLLETVAQFQLEHFRNIQVVDEKARKEFVSFVDIESEEKLQAGLKEILPEAGFYGEETGKHGNQDLTWIVDPIDGTTNYISGLEQFSISVALAEHGQPIAGVVYKPYGGDCFSAIKGQGAFLNDEPLNQLEIRELSTSLIGTGFPYRSPDLHETFFHCAGDILKASRGLRRLGSAALDLSYVAAGFFQGFWESELQCYDVAAAVVLMHETGAILTNEKGNPYDIFNDRILVAACPGTHEELLKIVSKHYS